MKKEKDKDAAKKNNKNKFDFTYRDKALDLLDQLNSKEENLAEEERKIDAEITSLSNQIQAIQELLSYITDVDAIEKKMTQIEKLNNKIVALKHRESALNLSMKNKYNDILDNFYNLVSNGLTTEFRENIEILRIELFSKLLQVLEIVEDIKQLGEDYSKASDNGISIARTDLNGQYYPILATFGVTNGIDYVPGRRMGALTVDDARYYLEMIQDNN